MTFISKMTTARVVETLSVTVSNNPIQELTPNWGTICLLLMFFVSPHKSPSGAFNTCPRYKSMCKIGQHSKPEQLVAWDTVSKGICIRCIKLSDHKNKFCHLLYAKTLYQMHTLFGKRWRANWVFWVNLIKKPSWSSEPPMEFEQCFWSTRESCWRY